MERILLLLLMTIVGLARSFLSPPSLEELKLLCSDHSAEMDYERNQFYELTKCLAQELNATEFRQQILSAVDHNKVDAVVDKVCKKLPEIIECTSKYVSSIGPCMKENEKREKDLWRNLRQMNMEFACGVGRNHLIKFIDEGGIQCVATHRSTIIQCVNDKFPELLKQQSDTQIVKTLTIITQQHGKCNSLKEVEECVNSELLKCMDPDSLSIIRQYFSSLDVLFDCNNRTNEEKERISTEAEQGSSEGILKAIAQMESESLQILLRIREGIDKLVTTDELQAQRKAVEERQLLDVLERQADAIEKIALTVDGGIIPHLRKGSGKGRHHLYIET